MFLASGNVPFLYKHSFAFYINKKKRNKRVHLALWLEVSVCVCARARGLRYFPTSAQVTLLTWDH